MFDRAPSGAGAAASAQGQRHQRFSVERAWSAYGASQLVRRGRAVVPLGRHLRRTKRLQYSKSNSSVIVSTVAYAEFLLSNYGTL